MLLEETLNGVEGLLTILFHFHNLVKIVQFTLQVLPSQLLLTVEGDGQGADRDMGGLERQEFRLDQGDVEQVTRIVKDTFFCDVNSVTIVLQEGL